jgi:hypothetical protein
VICPDPGLSGAFIDLEVAGRLRHRFGPP